MTAICVREPEVVQAVLAGRDAATDDHLAHAAGCASCREAMTLAVMLRDDRDSALADVHVPAAGQLWWRVAIRARLEAAHAAERPLTWAHGLAGASVVGVTAACLTMAWPTVSELTTWLGERAGAISPDAIAATGLAAAMLQRTVPFGLAAAFVLLAPIALYVAFADRD